MAKTLLIEKSPSPPWGRLGEGPYYFVPVGDATPARVVRADFDGDSVTRQDTNVELTHSSTDGGRDDEPVVAFNAKHRIRQRFLHHAVEFELVALGSLRSRLSLIQEIPNAEKTRFVTSSTVPTPLTRFNMPRFS